jgi:hypothetical protein
MFPDAVQGVYAERKGSAVREASGLKNTGSAGSGGEPRLAKLLFRVNSKT